MNSFSYNRDFIITKCAINNFKVYYIVCHSPWQLEQYVLLLLKHSLSPICLFLFQVSNVHNVNAVKESPHEKMQVFVQMAWSFSTGLGIILFLAEITIICWVQFISVNQAAAIASTVVVAPVLVIFLIFAAFFYKRLISHKYEKSYQDLETLGQELAELQNHSAMETLNPNNSVSSHGALQTV